MASMDVSESRFQTPARKKRKPSDPPSLLPAKSTHHNALQLQKQDFTDYNRYLPKVQHTNKDHERTEAVLSKPWSFLNQADTRWLNFYRRYSQRFCYPAE